MKTTQTQRIIYFFIFIFLNSGKFYGQISPSEIHKSESNKLDDILISALNHTYKKIAEVEKDANQKNINQIKAKLHYNAGSLLYDLNRFQESINEFNKSVSLLPIESVFFKRGMCYYKLRKYGYAINDLDSQIDLFDKNNQLNQKELNDIIFKCYIIKGICYSELKNFEKAVEECTTYIEKFKNYDNVFQAHFFRAGYYSELEKTREAVYDFTSVINLAKEKDFSLYKVAIFSRAFERVKLKDNYGALGDLDKMLLLESNHIESYVLRSEIYLKIGNANLALTNANQALNLNTNHINALISRGKSKIYLKDLKGGCMDFSRAGELGSDLAWDLIKNNCQ
jgi:tetratricopeptide (TPR) repeat protein